MSVAKVQVVVKTLDELPGMVVDPKDWLTVRSSFKAAIDGKLSSWFSDSVDSEEKKTLVVKFLETLEEVKDHEDVKALPLQTVCDSCNDSAELIRQFRQNIQGWSLPCGVATRRQELSQLFHIHDGNVCALRTYEMHIDGLIAKIELDVSAVKSKNTKDIKTMKHTLMTRLTNQGVPRIVAKVIN